MDAWNLEDASFSGHESFPLRYAWLKKGYDSLTKDPEFFSQEDAMVKLGTGKNMVRSVRHWGLTLRMWHDAGASRGRRLEPTSLGTSIFADDGWDPYLEDTGSLWWLHYLLATNPQNATTYAWTFARSHSRLIHKDELLAELELLIERSGLPSTSPNTIKRDIDVLIRSYSPPEGSVVHEDIVDSPLAQLGLLRRGVERGTFELVQGPQPTLPLGIFEAAVLDFIDRAYSTMRAHEGRGSVRTLALDELCYALGSPGRVFHLTERSLSARVNELVERSPERYAFDETAGIRQLLLLGEPSKLHDVLAHHYSSFDAGESAAPLSSLGACA